MHDKLLNENLMQHRRPEEAIILAGGLGTRLRSISGDLLPKPMMPVAGRPFLAYLLDQLQTAGVRRTVLAVGHRHEAVITHFGAVYGEMSLEYSREDAPLGTGGALAKALAATSAENLILLNGDSYYDIDISHVFAYHLAVQADITIALKQLDDCSRYGSIAIQDDRITAFHEKGRTGSGLINCGIYAVNRRILGHLAQHPPFSFESDVLSHTVSQLVIRPYVGEGYFIDIGIPEDYQRAQHEFAGRTGAAC